MKKIWPLGILLGTLNLSLTIYSTEDKITPSQELVANIVILDYLNREVLESKQRINLILNIAQNNDSNYFKQLLASRAKILERISDSDFWHLIAKAIPGIKNARIRTALRDWVSSKN